MGHGGELAYRPALCTIPSHKAPGPNVGPKLKSELPLFTAVATGRDIDVFYFPEHLDSGWQCFSVSFKLKAKQTD